jgi:hypothetical protein
MLREKAGSRKQQMALGGTPGVLCNRPGTKGVSGERELILAEVSEELCGCRQR